MTYPFNHISLFSGTGGFDLASELAGWCNILQVEKDEGCKKVLNYYWPQTTIINDIKETDFTIWRGRADVVSGGFPCQPYSVAGKQGGKADDRHLWPETIRAIREIEPSWVVAENVYGLVNWEEGLVFEEIHSDLEDAGYEVQSYLLPACGVNAPHRRNRVFFVAYSEKFWRRRLRVKEKEARSRKGNKESGCGHSVPNKEWYDANTEYHGPLATEGGGIYGEISARTTEGENRTEQFEGVCKPCIMGGLFTAYSEVERKYREEEQENGRQDNGGGRRRYVDYVYALLEQQEDDPYAHPISKGLSRTKRLEENPAQTSQGRESTHGSATELHNGSYYESFPTVSPVCSADDGFSDLLDSISFPSWRRESIKQLGNAVVPPLVLQIFQTINDFEWEKAYAKQ